MGAKRFETDERTSARMRGIRRRDTAAEMEVRRWLWRRGIRFTTHNRDLPGSPDLANRAKRWAIFVHGCFWHDHEGCKRATKPKNNSQSWCEKLRANRARDKRKEGELKALGFSVTVVWECEAKQLTEMSEWPSALVNFRPLLDPPVVS